MTAVYFLPSAFVPLAVGIMSSIPPEQGGVSSESVFVAVACVGSLGNVIATAAVQWGSFGGLLVGRGVSGSVYEVGAGTPPSPASHPSLLCYDQ
jgi:hypothetical protein